MNVFTKCNYFVLDDNRPDENINEASANVLFLFFYSLLWLDESPAHLFMFFDVSFDLVFSTWTLHVICTEED